ncbi:hypothetical protein [Infirmifilum sp.]|jgi:hypothetical protein|uniref:hypothetical protein n=1 Tax=Infirmifilum sp. TaxID=2856575 RepID=UPI003D0BE554
MRIPLLKYIPLALWVVAALAWLVSAPWSPNLGPSFSPERITLLYIVTTLGLFIPGIIFAYLFAQNPKWIAPPGKYVEGAKYSMLSPYQLTAAAIAAAVYAIGGLPTGINIDLPALICAFTAVYFGSVAAILAFSIGFFIRWLIGGASWLAIPLLAPAIAFIDSGVWSINGYIYWNIMRKEGAKPSYIKMIIAMILMILVHLVGWLGVYAFTVNPLEGAIAYAAFAFSTWYPTAIVFMIIGVLIAEPMYRAR